jgi:hypothetical protein
MCSSPPITEREELERIVVKIIEDEVGIGYEPNFDGSTDPRSLRLFGHGAAHVIVHELIARDSASNIVQQLRDLYATHPIVMKAADEIERLEGIVAHREARENS